MEYKVSIIVPVYNGERFLERCLTSLFHQTLKEIEVIIVDDCSSDNSLKIMKKFEAKYKNCTVVSLESNQGVSYARNIGIQRARGSYLAFCDADDYYIKHGIEQLYDKAVKFHSDMVIGNYYLEKNNIRLFRNITKNYSKARAAKTEIVAYGDLSSCGKLIKKSLIMEHDLQYALNLKRCEESTIIPVAAYFAKKVTTIPEGIYMYTQNGISASNNRKKEYAYFKKAFFLYCNYIDKVKYKEELEIRAVEQVLYSEILVMVNGGYSGKDIKKEIEAFNRKYNKWIKNLYIKKLNLSKKLFLYFVYYKMIFMLKALGYIHRRILG